MKNLSKVLFVTSLMLGLSSTAYSALASRGVHLEQTSRDRASDTVLLSQGRVFCLVARIRTGQLAVRFSPGGESRAGLNNGNTVRVLETQGHWAYIRIVDGPTRELNGVEGWVNSDYLDCWTQ
ncbi:MAG: SH3 domain-containing protein [Cyanobacteria bacterium SBLK]|nr:SH3 domain-containing protein [Cyanobacteria bacterium SBLK]